MTTLAILRTETRSRLVEPAAGYFSDAEINGWLNYGYRNFCAETEWLEKITCIPLTAATFEIALPSDMLHINQIMWDDRWPVHKLNIEEFRRYMSIANTVQSIRPFVYRLWPWDGAFGGKVRLYPIPNTPISTTLNGGINSSVTTIAVTDTSGMNPIGRIIVGSEQILYQGITGNNLVNCIRGDGFTTAAAHNNLDPVNVGRLEIYYSYIPPDMDGSNDCRLSSLFDEALISYATSIGLTKRDRYSQAANHQKKYEKLMLDAKDMKVNRDKDRAHAIMDDYPEWLM